MTLNDEPNYVSYSLLVSSWNYMNEIFENIFYFFFHFIFFETNWSFSYHKEQKDHKNEPTSRSDINVSSIPFWSWKRHPNEIPGIHTTTTTITSHAIITARRVKQYYSSLFYSVSVQTVYLFNVFVAFDRSSLIPILLRSCRIVCIHVVFDPPCGLLKYIRHAKYRALWCYKEKSRLTE